MTLWNEFTENELSALKAAVVTACTTAAGVPITEPQTTALGSLFLAVLDVYKSAGVRCVWDPEEVPGIVAVGRPYLPDIVAILRNSTGTSFVPDYGRRTSSDTVSKSGTESVSAKPAGAATLDERITVAVPDIRTAATGTASALDVDAAEKMRFDAEAEKSLYILFGKWVRRASFPDDL